MILFDLTVAITLCYHLNCVPHCYLHIIMNPTAAVLPPYYVLPPYDGVSHCCHKLILTLSHILENRCENNDGSPGIWTADPMTRCAKPACSQPTAATILWCIPLLSPWCIPLLPPYYSVFHCCHHILWCIPLLPWYYGVSHCCHHIIVYPTAATIL